MERRFDMSDFEQSLKDHADQFKMIPSKRVWNGLYNNLHPGSKWPSITVAVVFIITLVTIGSLNNNSSIKLVHSVNTNTNSATNNPKSEIETQGGEAFASQSESRSNSAIIDVKKNTNSLLEGEADIQPKNSTDKISSSSLSMVVNNLRGKDESQIQNKLPSNPVRLKTEEVSLEDLQSPALNPVNEQKIEISILQKPVITQLDLQPIFAQQQQKLSDDLFIPVSHKILPVPSSGSLSGTLIDIDRIEPLLPNKKDILSDNTAINANKFHKKKNNKIEWTFYVNPTISTVSFNKKTVQPSNNTSSLVVLSNQPSFNIIHNPRFGVETGAEMSLQIAKKLQFITGLNVSYSGFNNVSNLVHPTFATLNLMDKNGETYSKSYITHYGNGQSQDHINLVNYSIEASIPLGIQYNIFGNKKIKIDVSSLLEPSVVMRDNAYLISADGRYYVNDPMLVRRTNVDGHFGSYITFIGKKIKWHLGPDFRYQLFSTYKNIYPTKEHLVDYGIRIGISK
jgi:hypothetical protein